MLHNWTKKLFQRCFTFNLSNKPRRTMHSIKHEDAREFSVPLPYGQIAGKEWGNLEGYPILCLHGLADNCDSFAPLAPLLSDRFHYLAPDAVGHGLSTHIPPGTTMNYWDLVIYVRRIVRHFKLQKMSILGHSMGGGTALLYASLYPDAVDRIMTLDIVKPITVPLGWHTQNITEAIEIYLELERKTAMQTADNVKTYTQEELVNRYVEAMGGAINPEAVWILLKRGSKKMGNGYVYSHDPRMMMPSIMRFAVEEQRRIIKGLKCDLKVVKARQGPLYEPAELLEEFKGYYAQQCRSYAYDDSVDGTHHFHMHHPERLAPIVNDFFACLPTTIK